MLPTMTITLIGVLYCNRCKRRQRYIDCVKCSRPLCALCSWTVSVPRSDKNGAIDERCRECVEK